MSRLLLVKDFVHRHSHSQYADVVVLFDSAGERPLPATYAPLATCCVYVDEVAFVRFLQLFHSFLSVLGHGSA